MEFGVERRGDPMDSVTKKPRALQFCSGHGQVPEPSLARMGGGRPALTSRPSPDPLNGELQACLTLTRGKGPTGLPLAPMPGRRSYEDDPGRPRRAGACFHIS